MICGMPPFHHCRSDTSDTDDEHQSRKLTAFAGLRPISAAVTAWRRRDDAVACLPCRPMRKACRSCATPRSRHWCVTMRGPILQGRRPLQVRGRDRPGQRPQLQRVRRRAAHLHQHGRSAAVGNAERDHRRHCPRSRPLAGGHQKRLREQMARAQTMVVVATLLGVGAMAAGAATDRRRLAQAGGGIMAGGGELARRGVARLPAHARRPRPTARP